MWIVHNMRWIMLASGGLTATMVQAAFAPDAALQSNFGETVNGPLAHLVARNCGALIALVLSEGARYLSHQAGVAVAIDSVMVVLFGSYLVAARSVAVRAEAEPTGLSV